jgi:hypothetical protein
VVLSRPKDIQRPAGVQARAVSGPESRARPSRLCLRLWTTYMPRSVIFSVRRSWTMWLRAWWMRPGINLADSWVFLAIAMALATLDISKATDEGGNPITPKEEHTTGVIRSACTFYKGVVSGSCATNSYPKPFPCSIRPRSIKAEALIRSLD